MFASQPITDREAAQQGRCVAAPLKTCTVLPVSWLSPHRREPGMVRGFVQPVSIFLGRRLVSRSEFWVPPYSQIHDSRI